MQTKIIKSQKQFVEQMLKNMSFLKPKELDILILRFGLDNENPKTLHAIGQKYNITRERVRQIIYFTKKKIDKNLNPFLKKNILSIEQIVQKNGGLATESKIVADLNLENSVANLGIIRVLAHLNSNLIILKKTLKTKMAWSSKKFSIAKVTQYINEIEKILDSKKQTLTVGDILKKMKTKQTQAAINSIIDIANTLMLSKNHRVGKTSWPDINPKNTKDKIYYVLNEAEKPLHFREIWENIKNSNFAGRVPSIPTVHNELIADLRFVLIGKGIYALTKWGYKPGTVKDLLNEMLKKSSKSINQNEIIDKILKMRMISKNTIVMNLISNSHFVRSNDGNWQYKK